MTTSTFGHDAFRCKGKTIKKVYASDPFGCDTGFVIVFTDDSELTVLKKESPSGKHSWIEIELDENQEEQDVGVQQSGM